ncbi:MAG: glycine cleavage system protein GcvH [Desulfovibrio sp.]|jgi:glycine cleavage system H protein
MQEQNFPDDRRYTAEHIWIKPEGEDFLIGITDYAQSQLGEICFVDLPGAGASFQANQEFGTIESVKSVNALYMPIAATVVEMNAALEDEPTIVNASPYAEGWLLCVRADDPSVVSGLLSAEQYKSSLN